ncbi:hypothetical protein NEFER03_1699 [Nematocida sp. LUAm3]|nr:hypothetical protein NEFER03_1699 [Nematocida sp. LUAm3]KAI5175689.1 hypothetical protein NEFER02_1576 [Nematocida sp. LUAm2]KAI5178595.1 hypothetical protein NEFER01_1731 [Nematocida sp. LUAm1]
MHKNHEVLIHSEQQHLAAPNETAEAEHEEQAKEHKEIESSSSFQEAEYSLEADELLQIQAENDSFCENKDFSEINLPQEEEVHSSEHKTIIEEAELIGISTRELERLTWVQRQILKMEVEITKQQTEAENERRMAAKEDKREDYLFRAEKGKWIKKEDGLTRTQEEKRKRFSFRRLFGCFSMPFSRTSIP